jgi:protein involved in ribonucleotide reduction
MYDQEGTIQMFNKQQKLQIKQKHFCPQNKLFSIQNKIICSVFLADPTKILLMNGILAMGAITSGNLNHGNLFIQTTKYIKKNFLCPSVTLFLIEIELLVTNHFVVQGEFSVRCMT